MSCEDLKKVVTRLEVVAEKLESISLKSKSTGGSDEGNTEIVEMFKPICDKTVTEFVGVAKKISPDVGEEAELMKNTFLCTLDILKIVACTKKPTDQQLGIILTPLSESIQKISNFASTNFKSAYKSHLEAIGGFVACFGWIQAPGKPATHISQSIESGMFYANRVLTQFKDKGADHKVFVQSLKKCFDELKEYTHEYHSNGCLWNMKGKEYSGSVVVTSTPQATSTTQVPTPAKVSATPSTPTSPAALFAAINKGTGISSGLRKVDDSMKTHKNPNLRAGAIVVDKEKPTPTSTTTTKTTTVKPPLHELQGKKWLLDNQIDQPMINITEGDISYTVSMFNGKNSNLIITPKMNSVSLEKCINCKIQLKAGLISFIEVTNCKKIEIHADEVLPFVNVNSCDAVQVYLNNKSIAAQISTNTSTGINVCYWSPETDLIEYPVPEMFVSFLKDGKLITEIAKNA